jgi:hypothetical protein
MNIPLDVIAVFDQQGNITPSYVRLATLIAVTNPDYLGNYATLVITMTSGGIKEYSLPIVNIDNFIT